MEPKVKFKAGGSFVTKPPRFSADGQTVFVVWKNTVISYNTKTAKRLRQFHGVFVPIVDFEVHSFHNAEHVTACTVAGEVISWKADDVSYRGLRVKVPGRDLNVQSFNLITPADSYDDDKLKFLVSYISGENNRICFSYFHLAKARRQPLTLTIRRDKFDVAVNSSRTPYVAIIQGQKLYYSRLRDEVDVYKHGIAKGRYFTCVACHPEEECVITGDSQGRVLVWYNLCSRKPTQAVFHWHTLPVRCVSFSASGSDFYSGGAECVLVKWHLDNPHYKQFLPRLPSSIENIAVASENQFIAVATADNGIRVLDPRFETVSIIQNLVLGMHLPAGMMYDQRTKSLVLNGYVGHVQFFSVRDVTLLYNLDIVGQNKLTQERNIHIENTNVTKIAADSTGLWLATVEERADVSFSFELRLKFWTFNTVKQLFELNTVAELPHEKSITQLLFQPSYDDELRCVTVGNDKKFKVWQLVNADTVYHKGNAWSCSRVGFYRDLPCNTLSFSSDGSLMAVGFGPIVTTWLPDTCELKCSLVHPTNRERLLALQFGTANQCHLLVAATSEQLSVWNLLSLTMIWTVPLHVSLLVANAVFPHMAVFTTDRKLFIFYPESSTPLYTHALDKETENVVAATFVSSSTSNSDSNLHWYRGSQLYFITSNQELYCLGGDEDPNESIDALSENLSSSLFTSMIPKQRTGSGQNVQPVQHLTNISCKNKQLKQLLDAPVHTMVPIRLTCGSILKSLVLEHKLSIQQSDVT